MHGVVSYNKDGHSKSSLLFMSEPPVLKNLHPFQEVVSEPMEYHPYFILSIKVK